MLNVGKHYYIRVIKTIIIIVTYRQDYEINSKALCSEDFPDREAEQKYKRQIIQNLSYKDLIEVVLEEL